MIAQMDDVQNNTDLNWARFNSVFLIEVVRGNKVFTSTAVAIDRKTILTAAHSIDGADSVTVCVGHEYTSESKRLEANYWIINPNYNPSNRMLAYVRVWVMMGRQLGRLLVLG